MLPTFKSSSGILVLILNHLHPALGLGPGWNIPPIQTSTHPPRRTSTQALALWKRQDIVAVGAVNVEYPTVFPRRRSYRLCVASSNDSSLPHPPCCTSETNIRVVQPQIILRNATIDDMTMLLAWDEKEHLQGSYGGDPDFNDWNWDYELRRNDLSWRYQLIAQVVENENNTIPIGFVQIIDPLEEESHYWGIDCEPNLRAIDIWIGDERFINRGYGTQIMKEVLQSSFVFGNTNVTGVIIDPMADNYAAHRFYQRLGFIPVRIRYFGPDRCLIHRMNRTDYYNANPDRIIDCNTSKPAF